MDAIPDRTSTPTLELAGTVQAAARIRESMAAAAAGRHQRLVTVLRVGRLSGVEEAAGPEELGTAAATAARAGWCLRQILFRPVLVEAVLREPEVQQTRVSLPPEATERLVLLCVGARVVAVVEPALTPCLVRARTVALVASQEAVAAEAAVGTRMVEMAAQAARVLAT